MTAREIFRSVSAKGMLAATIDCGHVADGDYRATFPALRRNCLAACEAQQ